MQQAVAGFVCVAQGTPEDEANCCGCEFVFSVPQFYHESVVMISSSSGYDVGYSKVPSLGSGQLTDSKRPLVVILIFIIAREHSHLIFLTRCNCYLLFVLSAFLIYFLLLVLFANIYTRFGNGYYHFLGDV